MKRQDRESAEWAARTLAGIRGWVVSDKRLSWHTTFAVGDVES